MPLQPTGRGCGLRVASQCLGQFDWCMPTEDATRSACMQCTVVFQNDTASTSEVQKYIHVVQHGINQHDVHCAPISTRQGFNTQSTLSSDYHRIKYQLTRALNSSPTQ